MPGLRNKFISPLIVAVIQLKHFVRGRRYVWAALGLHPVPGQPVIIIGMPTFATAHVAAPFDMCVNIS